MSENKQEQNQLSFQSFVRYFIISFQIIWIILTHLPAQVFLGFLWCLLEDLRYLILIEFILMQLLYEGAHDHHQSQD